MRVARTAGEMQMLSRKTTDKSQKRAESADTLPKNHKYL